MNINKNDLMIGDIFEVELRDRNIRVEIFKIGDKQVDILTEGKERVCLMNSLVPLKLTDDILINECKFEKRQLKINGGFINDLFKVIGDYFVSLNLVDGKYNLSISSIEGEKICESFNIEYLHKLQNIVKSHIKLDIFN